MRTICGSGKEDVFVPCPHVTASDVRFDLFKNQKVIYNRTCNLDNKTWTCASHTRAGVRLHQNELNMTGFSLTGLNESSHGIYRCEGTVTFPPPLKVVQSDVKIVILIEGKYIYQALSF